MYVFVSVRISRVSFLMFGVWQSSKPKKMVTPEAGLVTVPEHTIYCVSFAVLTNPLRMQ